MKIYIASSWRNNYQHNVVNILREDGHEVYDFKEKGDGWGNNNNDGPGGFGWHEVDERWLEWDSNIPNYLEGLKHPRAEEGFRRDMDALIKCDACIMVMPCGPSASMEMGWACGAKKPTYIYIPAMREPELMVKMADLVTDNLMKIRLSLSNKFHAPK